jgi:hypothetical protein
MAQAPTGYATRSIGRERTVFTGTGYEVDQGLSPHKVATSVIELPSEVNVRLPRLCAFGCLLLCSFGASFGQSVESPRVDQLELHNVKADLESYQGRTAIRIVDVGAPELGDAGRLAIVRGSSFQDGTIEVDLAGDTAPDAAPELRGFVGLAFRVSQNPVHFECFYLRPKNGRSNDQLQRNHSAQYISLPGFPWEKLRSENPGKYESYVDLSPGQWTHVKIQVAGTTARMYVNGSDQPTLIVNDLKQPLSAGAIALWVGPGTIAHFSGLKVTH